MVVATIQLAAAIRSIQSHVYLVTPEEELFYSSTGRNHIPAVMIHSCQVAADFFVDVLGIDHSRSAAESVGMPITSASESGEKVAIIM